MQTFLPLADFKASAKVLDKKRCWKQVVEALQLINTLEGRSQGWVNHPCTRMWSNNVECLRLYYNTFLIECLTVRKINTQLMTLATPRQIIYPTWFGNEAFHASHRSNLLRKDKVFYSQYNWTEPDNLPYIWT